jgi:cation:H+ antiporter
MTWLLLLASFALLLGGALIFTNAVEWAGHRINLGQGAVGSILAAVATALPESIIPVVAIIAGQQAAPIAIGAILGAPFLLGTLGMFVIGVSTAVFARRRDQGRDLRVHRPTTQRDLVVFLGAFGVAVLLGAVGPRWLHVVAAVAMVVAYLVYAVLSVRRGGDTEQKEELSPLYLDRSAQDDPRTSRVVLQLLAGLAAIVGGAQLFVSEVEHLATTLGVSALLLALVIAPLATEMPEKTNSVIWVRAGKDALAVGNVSGAMVFQAMIPVAVGMAFTDWHFSAAAYVASAAAIVGASLALVTMRTSTRFPVVQICVWGGLYACAIGAIVVLT